MRIQQRWGSSEDGCGVDTVSPVRSMRRAKGQVLGATLCSAKRIVTELLVLVVLLLWVVLIAFNLASKLEPCRIVPVVHELGDRFITIKYVLMLCPTLHISQCTTRHSLP